MDLEIRRFKETIITLVNASPLPWEVKRMSINEIASAVSDAAQRAFEEQTKLEAEKQKAEE